MTAAIVSITPDDLDAAVDCPAARALTNLGAIHQLPQLIHLYKVTRHDGNTTAYAVVPDHAAEQWRAALGAPPFTDQPQPYSVKHTTERTCWFGLTVRLSYTTGT